MNKFRNTLTKLAAGAALTLTSVLSGTLAFAEADTTGAADAAATPTPAPSGISGFLSSPAGSWILIIGYILVFVVIGYFLIFRPQKKRKQEEEKMRSSITLGSEVTTIGGVCGKVVNIKDDNITIETSMDRTLMEFKNWAIREVKKLETDDDKA